MSNYRLYISTVKHLRPSQVAYRIWRRLGGRTPLRFRYTPDPDLSKVRIESIPVMPELDFDPAFLTRFDVDAILDDRIELLHHEEQVDWNESWHAELSTPLWRFNLHYHEYLLPLAKAHLDTGDGRYLDKAKSIVDAWMDSCPRSRGGVAWDPYVISMRAVNWLAFLGELSSVLEEDDGFVARVNASLAEQYAHLSQHLEKDLLANHYLENLKAIVVLACYFDDGRTLALALPMLQDQVDEQILPDGMHFELSPMYHKIVLEDLLRAAAFLMACRRESGEIAERFRLQGMIDALWSMERNADCTPLFNDSGDNVAKSRDALLACALTCFGMRPFCMPDLKSAGYFLLERKTDAGGVKVVLDAGMPGPSYALGHAHCDALSVMVFLDGEPMVVNRGTYAYQDDQRLEYKGTAAHSAPQVEGVEQSECWAPFRVARYARCSGRRLDDRKVQGTMIDQRGNRLVRTVALDDRGIVMIEDETDATIPLVARFHFPVPFDADGALHETYSPEFGLKSESWLYEKTAPRALTTRINLATREVS